jgi:hypothetical protein
MIGQLKRDHLRESKGAQKKTLDHGLHDVFKLLADDKKLPEKCHDHSLAGDWKDHQDYNIKSASLIWCSSLENQMNQASSWFV